MHLEVSDLPRSGKLNRFRSMDSGYFAVGDDEGGGGDPDLGASFARKSSWAQRRATAVLHGSLDGGPQWLAYHDAASDRVFYCNAESGESVQASLCK